MGGRKERKKEGRKAGRKTFIIKFTCLGGQGITVNRCKDFCPQGQDGFLLVPLLPWRREPLYKQKSDIEAAAL